MRSAVVLCTALGVVLAGCGGDGAEQAAETRPETAAASPETGCRDVGQPQPRPGGGEEEPTTILDADRTYRVRVRTSCGDFTITLDPESAPRATASFVALVERDFFDRTVFHRVVPGFVVQAGDPTATGTGGPGYTTFDAPAEDVSYGRGVVAMAKRADEPPGAAGSQFFVVTAEDAGLPPDYAVIGRVTEGMDVVERISVLGDPTTELPSQPVVIDDVELQVD